MLELALREGQGPVQLHQIAEAQDISPKYLEQLAASLRNAQLVRSERGPAGGYELDRAAAEITALDIVHAVEGPLALLECVGRSDACSRSDTCAARGLWGRVSSAMEEALRGTTLSDLREAQRSAETEAGTALCYQI